MIFLSSSTSPLIRLLLEITNLITLLFLVRFIVLLVLSARTGAIALLSSVLDRPDLLLLLLKLLVEATHLDTDVVLQSVE